MNANGLLPYDLFSWNRADKTMRYLDTALWNIGKFTYKMVTIHRIYVLCARWVLFVMPDSSSRLPFRSISLLPPPLLVINSLSCSPLGGGRPFPMPPTRVDPISLKLQTQICLSIINQEALKGYALTKNCKTTRYFMVSVIGNVLFIIFRKKGYFIAYKSSTTRDPPRPLPGAEVRDMDITDIYWI